MNPEAFESNLNFSTYANFRNKESVFFKSELHFVKKVIPNVHTILDIGSASGGFYNLVRSWNPSVSYTGVELNSQCVAHAKQLFHGIENCRFLEGSYPSVPGMQSRFELINMFEILMLSTEWKNWLSAMLHQSKKYVTFTTRLCLKSASALDEKTSYASYLGVQRVPYYIFNLDEFISEIHKIPVPLKKISAYGYPMPPNPKHHHLPVHKNDVYVAQFLIELGGDAKKPILDLKIEES